MSPNPRDEQIARTAAAGMAAARASRERHLAALDFDDFLVAFAGSDSHSPANLRLLKAEHDAIKARQAPAPAAEPLTYATAIGYSGQCEGTPRCDPYNRCSKHRDQDAARGDRNAHFRSYSD